VSVQFDKVLIEPAYRKVAAAIGAHILNRALREGERLPPETELARLFPDCELGAMPPFGNLYGMPVYLDSGLAAEEMITFNAGTHRDVVHMRTSEFRKLVQPTLISLAREAAMWR